MKYYFLCLLIILLVSSLTLGVVSEGAKVKKWNTPRPPRPSPSKIDYAWRGLQDMTDSPTASPGGEENDDEDSIIMSTGYPIIVGVVFAILGVMIGFLCLII